MANETAIEVQNPDSEKNRWGGGIRPFKASYGKLMMWYFLLSDAFTFAGFLIAYGALRFSMDAWPIPDHVFSTAPFGISHAPLIFVTFMTFVLIVSSVTVLRAVQEGKLENRMGVVKWMVITIFGGAAFLGCQAWEWTNLISVEGTTIYNNPFSSSLEDGTYAKWDDMVKAAPNLVEGSTDFSVHYADGGHGSETVKYLYSPAEPNVKYYEKIDHHFFHRTGADEHGHTAGGEPFVKGDPYLIAYHDGQYIPGAYIDGAGKLKSEPMGPKAFGTLFFFITGFHGFHVFSGLVFLLIITMNTWSGFYAPRKNGHEMVEKVGLYWHFVDLVWVFVFLVFYLL
ncbi:MAG: cytochrome oxidase subunit III [Aureispira sp.]|nr:cytochrome oxidase subunit III [Aureispira sp.]